MGVLEKLKKEVVLDPLLKNQYETEMEIYKGKETQEGYKVIYRCRNSQCPEYEKNIEVIKDKC